VTLELISLARDERVFVHCVHDLGIARVRRSIAGTLAVLLRSIPAAEHAAIAAIRADKGIKAAIKAAKAAGKTS